MSFECTYLDFVSDIFLESCPDFTRTRFLELVLQGYEKSLLHIWASASTATFFLVPWPTARKGLLFHKAIIFLVLEKRVLTSSFALAFKFWRRLSNLSTSLISMRRLWEERVSRRRRREVVSPIHTYLCNLSFSEGGIQFLDLYNFDIPSKVWHSLGFVKFLNRIEKFEG